MKPKVIGFYWTLPVPWAGFVDLDLKDIDKAAQQSRTIALQRTAIRRWARDYGCELIDEAVYLEVAPDRGGEEIAGPLMTLVASAEALDAQIIFIDFGDAIQQRSHGILHRFVGSHADRFEPIWPSSEELDAFSAHFAKWRAETRDWQDAKPQRAAAARERALTLKSEGLSAAKIAAALNAEHLPSLTGKPWTGANLAKFLNG